MAAEPGYDGGQFKLGRVTVRGRKNEDGTVSMTVEGAGPWYTFQETRTNSTGKVTIQLGGVILGTDQQTTSRIYIDHVNGFSGVIKVPCIDKDGHPASEGRPVTRVDLERIASTVDHGIGLVLKLNDDFKDALGIRLGATAPSSDDLYGWCCLIHKARETGVLDATFHDFLGRPTSH
jgi:hypothetical protein